MVIINVKRNKNKQQNVHFLWSFSFPAAANETKNHSDSIIGTAYYFFYVSFYF